MYRHTSSGLHGPVSGGRPWWKCTPAEPSAAGGLNRLRTAPEDGIRADLVARVRREIAEGRYDTPDRWNAALDRLLSRLTPP